MVHLFIVVYLHILRVLVRSWMGTSILKVPVNRMQVAAALVQSSANDVQPIVQHLEMEQKIRTRRSLTMGLLSCCTNNSPIRYLSLIVSSHKLSQDRIALSLPPSVQNLILRQSTLPTNFDRPAISSYHQ